MAPGPPQNLVPVVWQWRSTAGKQTSGQRFRPQNQVVQVVLQISQISRAQGWILLIEAISLSQIAIIMRILVLVEVQMVWLEHLVVAGGARPLGGPLPQQQSSSERVLTHLLGIPRHRSWGRPGLWSVPAQRLLEVLPHLLSRKSIEASQCCLPGSFLLV